LDYERTVALYEKAGLIKKWKEDPESYQHKAEQDWYEKVKSPKTSDFYQAEELIRRDLVPPDWKPPHVDSRGKPLKYPIKNTNEIFRIRIADGSEWLMSRQFWTGLDQSGNPISKSFNDKEWFDDVLPIYTVKPENPRQRDSKMIREVTSIEHRRKYTVPFKAETVQKLYDMKNGSCNLAIKDETRDRPPYSVESLNHFMTRDFEELWSWASTPNYKMDWSYKDQLEASHIG
jgi:hypothetical protein